MRHSLSTKIIENKIIAMTDRFIKYSPRHGDEMLRAVPGDTALYLYSAIAKDPRPAVDILLSLHRNNIILLQDPDKLNSGHWTSLSFHPEKKEAYFFSSYGGKPDEEKNKWLSFEDRLKSGQVRNVINDGLLELYKRGWTIHYNDKKYQKIHDKTATCGIWTAAFLRDGGNPDQFAKHKKTVEEYYRRYFM